MARLALNFIGDLEVVRDGETLPLPPSKKTRALLAYLALNARAFRREHLCELLWEIPDDPRGSLRWSLSKLRRLVDDADHRRIVADRTNVRFDATDVNVDVSALRALVENGLVAAPIAVLEDAAERYRGNFLEGLELSNFHDFHAWCVAEREQVARAQERLLRTLVQRLTDAPERALPHARALVVLSPYDEAARASLIRLLVRLGRHDEAEQQYLLGVRMLKEVGATPSALFEAWRGPPGRVEAPRAEPKAAVRSSAPTSDTLVGRDSEATRLESALDEVIALQRAQLVLVRGEPGIGKSRLLETVARLARDVDAFILHASAFESETMRPFALWIDALRKAQDESAADDSEALDIFADQDHDNRERLFGRLSDLVARQSQDRPVVLIFDDVHWCDESSAAALHYVARTNRQRPLLGVLGAREDELRDNAAVQQALRSFRHDHLLHEIHLGPLPDSAVRALIESCAPEADSERLCKECGGNPLLAVELARAQSSGDSGGSLDELVRERLVRFDVEESEVIRWAAVVAPRIDVASIARLTGLDAMRVTDALVDAERLAILQGAGSGFRFSHDLVARSIYKEISPARRQVMHRRVAELLEQDTEIDLKLAADLAHHASQSGDSGLAARAMVSAGRLCLRFFANDEALSLARRGLQLAEELTDAERVCVSLDLHDIMLSAAPLDNWDAAAKEYVALAEQALDHGALSHARLGYHMASYVRWMHGQWADAREEILQSERVTRAGGVADHIVGMAETARCLAMLEQDLTRADAMLMEAKALAEREHVNAQAIPAALGMLRYHENKLDEAEEFFKEARTLAKSSGDRINEFQANEYLVMIAFERGRLDAARSRAGTLVEIGEKLREGSEAPFAQALAALCDYALEDERSALSAALDELRVADAKHRLAYILTRAALLDLERGRGHHATSSAGEALEYAEVLGRATEAVLAHAVLARAARAARDSKGYEEHAAAIADLEHAPVAGWARERAASLLETSETA